MVIREASTSRAHTAVTKRTMTWWPPKRFSCAPRRWSVSEATQGARASAPPSNTCSFDATLLCTIVEGITHGHPSLLLNSITQSLALRSPVRVDPRRCASQLLNPRGDHKCFQPLSLHHSQSESVRLGLLLSWTTFCHHRSWEIQTQTFFQPHLCPCPSASSRSTTSS